MTELFISDLDGTLLDNNKKITPYSVKIINRFIENGGIFSIATARTAGTVVDMVKDLSLNCPVVLMNGAMIFDTKEKKYIKYEELNKDSLLKVLKILKKNNADCFLYTLSNNTIIAYYENLGHNSVDFYNQRNNNNPYKIFKRTNSLIDKINEKCVYIALMDKKDKLNKIFNEISFEHIEKTIYMDTYNNEHFYLEIFSDKANKANGVKYLKKYTNADRVIAFGDNNNDLDMLRFADLAIATENAIDKVKETADIICKSNAEDGVAKYLNSIMS